MNFNSSDISVAQQLDKDDPLKTFRDKFVIDNPDEIYLNGNSLGPLPKKTKERLTEVINNQWGAQKVKGWQEGWFELAGKTANKIAKIIGADPGEVTVADSTSVNLYKLVYAALKLKKEKTKIVSDEFNFPSDLYIIQGVMKQFNNTHSIELVKSQDNVTIETDDIKKAIDKNTALVTLSHVCFKTGFLYDINEITRYAHSKGALVLWDLSHSAGAVNVDLNDADVDLAVGCTYKYLNGGPGSPAYLFVKKKLQNELQNPLWGWFGEENQFEFSLDYRAGNGIKKFQVGTPPILSLAGVDAGLDLILDAGIENIRSKSILQTEYLIYLSQEYLLPHGFKLLSPVNYMKRGSHVALYNEDAYAISRTVKAGKTNSPVIFDFRKPGIIRLSASPLYNNFEEIWKAVNIIKSIVSKGRYEIEDEIKGVT